jgi:long-chain fatty acid transport protein
MKKNSFTHSHALLISTSLLSTAISTTAFGAGFAINEQSVRTLGQAFSGRASDADNASTLMTNPAGMSLLKQSELSAGFVLIDAHSDIKNASSTRDGLPSSGSNDGDMIPHLTIPFAYYVQPIDNHWAAGFGIYSPYGLVTDYEDNFEGHYFGTKSELKIVTLQPTVSYKFDNGLSFGLGVTYNKVDGKLNKDVPFGVSTTSDIHAKVKGDDTAWGYNAGVLYEINENTRIGLTYFSKVDYTLEGHTRVENFPLGDRSVNASLDVTTPERIDLGLTHKLSPRLTLHSDITQTRWSRLKQIVVENDSLVVPDDSENLQWDNAWFYALGLSYELNDQWTLRTGIAYDESPIPNSTRSVRVPTESRKEFALGATWNIQKNLSVDFAYLYFKEDTAHVNISGVSATGHPISYTATYHNYANLVGAQLSWRF